MRFEDLAGEVQATWSEPRASNDQPLNRRLSPAWRVRATTPRSVEDGYLLLQSLIRDPRFRALSRQDGMLLVIAAVEWADGEGKFWVKQRTWSRRAGCSEKTIQRAVEAATQIGLIAQIRTARPGGFEGASTYVFDPALLPSRHAEWNDFAR